MSSEEGVKHRYPIREGTEEKQSESTAPSTQQTALQADPESPNSAGSIWHWLLATSSLLVLVVCTVYVQKAYLSSFDTEKASDIVNRPTTMVLETASSKSSGKLFPVSSGDRLFTKNELKELGSSSRRIHLAILGRVYDVTKGRKHYGPKGSYSFFAGRDATRSFVSGDFSDSGLTDDLEGLALREYLGIVDWVETYEKEYTYVGRLIGTFYDRNGEATEALLDAEKKIRLGGELQAQEKERDRLFPQCNSHWSGGKSRVWCSEKR
jgi:cytochrome b involved in lipid metabolism